MLNVMKNVKYDFLSEWRVCVCVCVFCNLNVFRLAGVLFICNKHTPCIHLCVFLLLVLWKCFISLHCLYNMNALTRFSIYFVAQILRFSGRMKIHIISRYVIPAPANSNNKQQHTKTSRHMTHICVCVCASASRIDTKLGVGEMRAT